MMALSNFLERITYLESFAFNRYLSYLLKTLGIFRGKIRENEHFSRFFLFLKKCRMDIRNLNAGMSDITGGTDISTTLAYFILRRNFNKMNSFGLDLMLKIALAQKRHV